MLYVFFKIFLKSKVIPLSEMDFQTEFKSMQEERENIAMRPSEDGKTGSWIRKFFNWF